MDTLSSVRRPKPSGVIWMKKGSSSTVKDDLSSINHLNLNKNVKRYSCKDLTLCNISHHRYTRSAHACNNARNAYCNSYDVDVNDLFVFDDISLRQSYVSKMPFRKKPIVQVCLWIIDSGCSKHMTGNRALLTNFMEKFLGTVRFGNNDFAVIAGYGDVVIGSMTIKKVYYVKDLLTGDHSSNLYTIALNEVASNSSACLLAKASSSCYLLNDNDDVGKLKAKGDIGVFVGYSKESAAFRIYNKRTRKIHESVNVNIDEILEMASKQFSLEPGLSNLNKTGKSLNPSIMKSSTTNVETSNVKIPSQEEEVFHESFKSFQKESSSSSLNDNVQQSLEETKDHLLYKIIGDPKSSVRTRGQLANLCLLACLLSSIEPTNVAEALKDANWVSAMQDELDQFARLEVWRLVPRPEGKTIIKTKWIFKNKKDESSLVI
uniref:Gag-Pol polyprotein n=1 Tax=Tanacetum cinerariifolium TaxID=118510 RepID=A0A6L2PAR6_TANCI|nr:Gag-Pol polyprotein [Tanacetum cinerariifolium]